MKKSAVNDSEQTLLEQLEAARQRIADLEIIETLHTQALEDLHVYQGELNTQNEKLRLAQESLSEINQRYRDLFNYAPVAYFLLDKTGSVIECNVTGCELLQEPRTSILGKPFKLYIAKNIRGAFNFHLAASNNDKISTLELYLEGSQGKITPAQVSIISESFNGTSHYRMTAVDISERKHAEEQKQLAATVFEDSSEGVVITDSNGLIQRVNPAFTVMTGYLQAEVIGKNASILSSGRHDQAFFKELWEKLSRDGHWQGQIWNRRKNGEVFPEWLKINTVFSDDRKVCSRVGIFKDTSEIRQSCNIREHFAFYDMLTELPNRMLFLERLKHALVRAQRDKKQVALLYLDLDRFKYVNDNLGHQMGDLLLQEVAIRLRQQLRADDTVARLGGDEFTVILSELGSLETAEEIAHRVASNICKHLAKPFQLGLHEISIASSIGIAYYPLHGQTYSELVKHADIAMYRAKNQGGSCYVTFSQDMNKQLQYRLSLESALRSAYENDELQLAYQPIFNAVSATVVGVEVLLRWNGPDGPVSPLEVIPIFEEIGLGNELACWVLRTACRELMAMPFWHKDPFWVSINVSPQVLTRNHIEWIKRVLAEFGMPAERLVIEVMEDHLRYNQDIVLQTLTEIRQQNIRIAVDDFGAGYSSLARLRDFPIDIIKIDQELIHGLPNQPKDSAIVVTIITLARELGLQILAEGVETDQQLQQLITYDCSTIQGFVYAKPMYSEEYQRWHASFTSRSTSLNSYN